jgi:hypothetical protein
MIPQEPFKMVCESCGGLSIKIDHPELAPSHTIVACGRCGLPRGTIGALRDMAKSPVGPQPDPTAVRL